MSARRTWGTLALIAALASLGALAAWIVHRNGWTLYYGDAELHLDIARRIVDSRTPGYEQIGTSWLPLPHLLMLSLAAKDTLWRSGLAGTIPSLACFVSSGIFLFAFTRSALGLGAACAALAVYATNPNLLYLASIPMTEALFLCELLALIWCLARFRDSGSARWAAAAGVVNLAATLTRYEGWFLIPFAALFVLLCARRLRFTMALVFGLIASLGPLYWLAHNRWLYGNALEFYNGPYSTKAIQGASPYPGNHDWLQAIHYYAAAVTECAGWPLAALAMAGCIALIFFRKGWPAALLLLPPVFYVWSMHSSGAPIYLPDLWPFSYYNTRYALAALPLLAFGAGACVLIAPRPWRRLATVAVVILAVAPWLIHPRPDRWICWKESQVNSQARRAWTRRAADILRSDYRAGTGIVTSFGDLIGIFREAGIPLRETLHEGNGPAWGAAVSVPRFFLHEEWAVAVPGDQVATAILRCSRTGPHYRMVAAIAEKGAPVIEIYKRD